MNVLGLHVGHDSSAAVVVDGRLVADVAEERVSRVKHDASLPVHAIAACLEVAGLVISDIDVVAVGTEAQLRPLNDLFDLWGSSKEEGASAALAAPKTSLGRRLGIGSSDRSLLAKSFPLAAGTELVHVAHHLAHAAAAYYTSGWNDKQLIVTLDGVGDGLSGAIWRGEAGKIEPLHQFEEDGSLGWFYGNVTEALGWAHGDAEGTTMALAAYGDPAAALDALGAFHPRFEDGSLARPHVFEPIRALARHGAFEWHSPEAEKIAALIPRLGRENIAAAAQRVLEEQVSNLIYPWLEREGTRALACAGGVFLNVKVNQRIRESGKVDRHHIYPNAGDAGLAAGAALHACHTVQPGTEIGNVKHMYLGPEYSNDEIVELLAARGLDAERRDDIPAYAARLLADGLAVGWVQGRMESGPRALGARSILTSPVRIENKEYLDTRVKLRPSFRPYCPSLAAERAADYLERPLPEPFMISAFDVRPEKRDAVPAVVHVDGTARPQTVEREQNARYWELIDAFGSLTGEYAVLNTSFNLQGEPIVCHPRDAIRAFYDSGLDYLILGDHVLAKPALRRPRRDAS